MLPKKNRLSSKIDIERVKAHGSLSNSKNFKLIILSQEDTSDSRFSSIVSNNVSKKAVIRNKIRRAIRSSVRKNLSNAAKGFDCLFIAKFSATTLTNSEIEQEIEKLLLNEKIIN